jgi:hypothetical protein
MWRADRLRGAGGIHRCSAIGEESVRSTIANAAVLLFTAVGTVSAQTAPSKPDVEYVMVLIAVAPTSTTGGERLAVLRFFGTRLSRRSGNLCEAGRKFDDGRAMHAGQVDVA